MKVPFLDLWRMHEPIANELRDEFARLLENNAFTGGDGVVNFEKSFADWTDMIIVLVSALDMMLLFLDYARLVLKKESKLLLLQ